MTKQVNTTDEEADGGEEERNSELADRVWPSWTVGNKECVGVAITCENDTRADDSLGDGSFKHTTSFKGASMGDSIEIGSEQGVAGVD